MQFQYYSILFHVDGFFFFSHQPDCRFLNIRNKVIKVIRLAPCILDVDISDLDVAYIYPLSLIRELLCKAFFMLGHLTFMLSQRISWYRYYQYFHTLRTEKLEARWFLLGNWCLYINELEFRSWTAYWSMGFSHACLSSSPEVQYHLRIFFRSWIIYFPFVI